MNCDKTLMRLYAVTDRAWTGEQTLYQQVEAALQGGATCLQLREKEMSDEAFLAEALEMKELCHRYHVPLIINDNVEVAIKSGADGIHVGQHDTQAAQVRQQIGPDMILGVSAQTVEQALLAEKNGADYLGVGAVFDTSTKKDADAVSHETVKAISRAVSIPICAIGGISKDNILELSGTGIDGVALVSAIFASKDIKTECQSLRTLSEKMASMKKVLTIAGSDSSGGAGIQADIKTITAHGMYAMSVITALTAQNTTGVYGVLDTPPEFVAQQLDCVFSDIVPDAVKIGMVSSGPIIHAIADKLREHGAQNIVVDPVMVSTSGSRLLSEEALDALTTRLLPLGTVITPNVPEAEVLCGFGVQSKDDMLRAARTIADRLDCAVLVKGGHLQGDAADVLYEKGQAFWFQQSRIDNPNSHGTGCTLSSAIACNLAEGQTLHKSIHRAKVYLTGVLQAGLDLGKGSGPLNHMYQL
ncbi:MAG: bifunctional hydroxymethylpyrimidine kinase/phosphomethylpyrimidine kinase [Firmicutes bacterium]|nr:bifunctional hydroxymethylpyrimidine kinase/phosphomethylpyrimidine kinase [Bacillota bacterium]NBI61690.1 bifunctional hydroxymethylpyrimidine kinase/phosphomethylpyrimidine kinase [Clostridiales bacterium]